jgi:hypothetical protein
MLAELNLTEAGADATVAWARRRRCQPADRHVHPVHRENVLGEINSNEYDGPDPFRVS